MFQVLERRQRHRSQALPVLRLQLWTWKHNVWKAKLWTHCVSNNIPADWCSRTNCPTNHAGAPAARWHVPSRRQVLVPGCVLELGQHLCPCSSVLKRLAKFLLS
ncbi:hypothetical protein ABBQ38_011731 [Trebouxia sp. C0009 RCD-2024]